MKPICAWFGLVACFALAGCDTDRSPVVVAVPVSSAPKSDVAIVTFCAGCHAMPNPASFAKGRWHHEVKQGIDIYRRSRRIDLVIPDFDATLAWFRHHAPDELSFETLESPSTEDASRFQRVQVPVKTETESGQPRQSSLTAVSHAFLNPSSADAAPSFALADMGSGHLWSTKLQDGELHMSAVGQVAHPAHIEQTDLDGDGLEDYLVADLGGFFPDRQKRGSLWWIHKQDGQWQRVPLKMGMMRVSDVRAADFDGDGDLDLLVAEFGMHFHGGIHLLTNQGIVDGVPQFDSRLLDPRPGAIHVPVIDLNGDGMLDFIALISQHHETIVAFLNRGDGTFREETIYEAGDPAYGSSGIELVDMDGDHDIDVLLSNGDTFDDEIPKPLHSIQWLENQGKFPFRHHHIGQMPGAYRAVAGDIDRDGDIDVAAVSLLIESNVAEHPPGTFDAVVYFERVDGDQFIRHRLQTDRCDSATCQLMDWDNDGDLDIVTFPYSTSLQPSDSITVFRNDL